MEIVFSLAILLISVVAHEVAHGVVALWWGDPTAKLQGRLTINPIKHLEVFGSILVPIITGMIGMPFGWAKPVPVNPYNFRNRRWGDFCVSIAGILVNLALAIIFGCVIRFGADTFPISFLYISSMVVAINITLVVLNAMPIPPLDGSRILFSILPARFQKVQDTFERYSLVIAVVVILVLWRLVAPLVPILFSLITGVSAQ